MASLKATTLCIILIILAADVAILAPLAASQSAYTITWIGGNDASWNNWNNPSNWDANRLPNISDDVFIPSDANVFYCEGSTHIRSLHSEGSLTIWSGSLSIVQDSVITRLNFNGGTLSSTSNITITNRLDWNNGGGLLVNCTLNVAAAATAQVSCYGGGLDNATFNNYGITTLTGSLSAYNGSVFVNHPGALFEGINNADIWPTFVNYGTVSIANPSNWVNFWGFFDNYGEMSIFGQSVGLIYGSNNSGIIYVGPSSTLVFNPQWFSSATHIMHEGSLITGEGNLALYGAASVDVRGDYGITGELLQWGREIFFHKDVNLTRFTLQSGVIYSHGNITIIDKLNWNSGGGLFVNSTLNVATSATAEVSCYYGGLDNVTFNNYGATLLTGTLSSYNDSVFVNHPDAVFNVTAQADVCPLFVNYGTVCIVQNTGMWFTNFFKNYGQVIGISGSFGFTNGSDNYGLIKVGANSNLDFRCWTPGTAHVMHEGSIVTGEGKVALHNDAVVNVCGNYNVTGELLQWGKEIRFYNDINFTRLNVQSGLISIPSNTTVAHLIAGGGIISCPANITVTGRLDWNNGGGLFANCTVNLLSNAAAQVSCYYGGLDNATFNNYGIVTLTGTLSSCNGSVFVNHPNALFEGVNNAELSPTFVNYGTVRVAESADWVNFWGFFDNYGEVLVTGKSVAFAYGSNNSGIIRIGPNSTLTFNPQWFSSATHIMKEGSLVTGEGNVYLYGKVVFDVCGDYNVTGELTNWGSEVRFHKDINLTRLAFVGGVISCPANITVSERLDWNNGGGLLVNCTLNLLANATSVVGCYFGLDNATFNNYGTTTLAGDFGACNGSVFINHPGALFDITAGQGDITSVFINYGTIRRPSGIGSVNFNSLKNYGSVYTWAGTLNFNSLSNYGLLSIYVTADVTTNQYVQGENGSLAVNLGNLGPNEHGKLIIQQAANLDGSLFVDSDAQVIPYFDWWYEIIKTPQNRVGQFSSVNSRVTGNPSVTIRYNSESVTVGVAASAALNPNRAGAIEFVQVRLMYPIEMIGYNLMCGVTLVKQGEPDIIGSVGYYPARLGYYASFNLRNATPGVWDVVITYRYVSPWDTDPGPIYTRTFPASFTIEDPRMYTVWTKIVGLDEIRVGQEMQYYVLYGNKGNLPAYDTILTITVPPHTEYKIDPITGDVTTLQTLAQGTTGNAPETFDLWLYDIPAYSTQVLSVKIKALNAPIIANQPIQLRSRMLISAYSNFTKTGNLTDITQSGLSKLLTNALVGVISELIKDGNITDVWGGQLRECVEANVSSLLTESFQPLIAPQILQASNMLSATPAYLTPSDYNIYRDNPLLLPTILVLGTILIAPAAAPWLLSAATFAFLLEEIIKHKTLELAIELLEEEWRFLGDDIIDILVHFTRDPNEKNGPVGFVSQTDSLSHYIQGGNHMPYVISFENLANATARVQEITISDKLDMSKLDLDTFNLGPVTIANKTIIPLAGSSNFVAELDLRPDMNLIVKIQAYLNKATGEVTWHFIAVDADTKLPPSDPLAGFLPPNINSPEGQGSVTYWVTPKEGLPTGTQIRNIASITFDFNEPIQTNEWLNTLDNDLPQSNISQFSPAQTSNNFTVTWAGTDIGSGIQYYNIYVSTNNGNYALWLNHTTNTSATFYGQSGKTYNFYSIAADNTNNIEAPPALPDATTTTPQDTPATVLVTVTSNPAGAGLVKVDGTVVNTPVTFSWVPGSQHTIEALSPTAQTGTQHLWLNWSDGGSQSHSYITPTSSATLTASYQIQYQVSFQTSDSKLTPTIQYSIDNGLALSNTAPFSIWVNSTQQFSYTYPEIISAGSDTRYVLTSTTPNTTQTVTGPLNITGTYKTQYRILFKATPSGVGQIIANEAFYDAGSQIILNAATIDAKYTFYAWSATTPSITFASNTSASTTAQISSPGTITATFGYILNGNKHLTLSGANNVIIVTGGNNQIDAKQATSSVVIKTGSGNNKINFGEGNNVYTSTASGNDQITTGNGDNTISISASGNYQITTGSGNDKITLTGTGNNNINTGNGNNKVTVGNGNNQITTGSGNDIISAGNGNNNIKAGAGNDQITVGNGNNTIDGGAGIDSYKAGTGKNKVTNCES